MKKSNILLSVIASLVLLFACSSSITSSNTKNNEQDGRIKYPGEKVVKTDSEWKSILSDFDYYVLRESGTEKSFSGEFWDNHQDGIYTCKGCGLELFDSNTKFESGTGWPSYYQPINPTHVGEIKDYTHGWSRVEVVCNRCDGHLGHVFKDGPKPTGLRYCINSASLDFVKR